MVSAFCPFATQRIIPPGPNDPPIRPRLAILHVDAGNAESLFDFFNGPSGGVESHFFVKKTGEIEQYRGILDQADANLDANDFAVSIETQGFEAGEWTAEQLASIKRLLLWLRDTAGIPLVKVPTWDGSGVGYHTQFGAPSHWTPSVKTCPGPDRIKQFAAVLVPWMADPQEDNMTPDDWTKLTNLFAAQKAAILADLGEGKLANPFDPMKADISLSTLAKSLIAGRNEVKAIAADVDGIKDLTVDRIAEAVAARITTDLTVDIDPAVIRAEVVAGVRDVFAELATP